MRPACEVLRLLERLEEPHAETDHPDEPALLEHVHELEHSVQGVGDRLLHEDVHAPVREPQRGRHVVRGGHADERRPGSARTARAWSRLVNSLPAGTWR